MKAHNKYIRCAICGEPLEQIDYFLCSFVDDEALDGVKKSNRSRHDILNECPNCHYIAYDLETKPTKYVRKLIATHYYQNIFKNKDVRNKTYAQLLYAEDNQEERIDVYMRNMDYVDHYYFYYYSQNTEEQKLQFMTEFREEILNEIAPLMDDFIERLVLIKFDISDNLLNLDGKLVTVKNLQYVDYMYFYLELLRLNAHWDKFATHINRLVPIIEQIPKFDNITVDGLPINKFAKKQKVDNYGALLNKAEQIFRDRITDRRKQIKFYQNCIKTHNNKQTLWTEIN